jgi:hypothetical protein
MMNYLSEREEDDSYMKEAARALGLETSPPPKDGWVPVPGCEGDVDWGMVDQIQMAMSDMPQQECPLDHAFTPGLYSRTIFMPAGTLIVSKIHKTEHQYVISAGKVRVWTREQGVVHLEAPHVGITKPGTRRVLYIDEDCVWTTFHPTDETDLDKIEEQLILRREINRPLTDAPQIPCLG